jgi:hypothetical protein
VFIVLLLVLASPALLFSDETIANTNSYQLLEELLGEEKENFVHQNTQVRSIGPTLNADGVFVDGPSISVEILGKLGSYESVYFLCVTDMQGNLIRVGKPINESILNMRLYEEGTKYVKKLLNVRKN